MMYPKKCSTQFKIRLSIFCVPLMRVSSTRKMFIKKCRIVSFHDSSLFYVTTIQLHAFFIAFTTSSKSFKSQIFFKAHSLGGKSRSTLRPQPNVIYNYVLVWKIIWPLLDTKSLGQLNEFQTILL